MRAEKRRLEREARLNSYPTGPINAVLRGSGAIAQSLQKAIALGTRSVYLGGDNAGVVNTGFNLAVNVYHHASDAKINKRRLAEGLRSYLRWLEIDTSEAAIILPVKVGNPEKKDNPSKVNDPPVKNDRIYKILGDVFVALDVVKSEDARTIKFPCGHMLSACPRQQMVVLAKEGQGKTMTLLNLANVLCKALLTRKGFEQYAILRKDLGLSSYKNVPVPIYLALTTYAEEIAQHKLHTPNLRDFLDRHMSSTSFMLPNDFFSVMLRSGQPAVLMLDGLDEIIDPALRARVAEQIKSLSHGDHHVQMIVTSRESAYFNDSKLGSHFEETRIAPFDKEKREEQIHKIYRAHLEDFDKADRATRRILDEIDDLENRAKKSESSLLIDSPLMTTLAVSVREYTKAALPDHRIAFLMTAIEALLRASYAKEATEREILQKTVGGWKEHLNLLSAVARQMFDAGERMVNEKRLDIILKSEKIQPHMAKAFKDYAESRGSPFRKQSNSEYRFMHGSLLDALAARHIAQNSKTARELALALTSLDYIANEHGRDVAYLLAGYLHEYHTELLLGEKALEEFIKELLVCANTPAMQTHTRLGCAQVALDAARDYDPQNSALYARLAQTAAQIYEDMPMMDAAPLETRLALGKILTETGDPRPHVMTTDAMRFCLVPAGPFLMGSDDSDPQADKKEKCNAVEWNTKGYNIPYDYWMGQHPVTNAQYAEFVNDGGYANPKWWGLAIHAGVWKDGILTKRYAGVSSQAQTLEQKQAEYDAGHAREVMINETMADELATAMLEKPNHPSAFITWYEAVAYCEWLTERWRGKGWISEHEKVCLPNEPEWEKAARGGVMLPEESCLLDIQHLGAFSLRKEGVLPNHVNKHPRRFYCWGRESDFQKANVYETRLRTTTPTGCFANGRSPYGCVDMLGNVWEWTRSLWGPVWFETEDIDSPRYRKYDNKLEYPYPYVLADGRENQLAGKNIGRVLRGGSWLYDLSDARCAVRSNGHPVNRNFLIGFRVMVAPV